MNCKLICFKEKYTATITKIKVDIDFFNNCKQLGVYPKFLIFKLPNVSNKDASSIRKKFVAPSLSAIKNFNMF